MPELKDHRADWTDGLQTPKMTKDHVEKVLTKGVALLKRYMAAHGNWEEITSHTDATHSPQSGYSWRFTVCQCALCQEAEKLVGHPATPNG